jgi:transcriptional regulator with XRE-family HTH domain
MSYIALNKPYSLAQSLRIVRERCGLTLRETAARLGCSEPLLSMYETGFRNLPADRLKRLAGILIEALEDRQAEERRVSDSTDFESLVPELAAKFAKSTMGREEYGTE